MIRVVQVPKCENCGYNLAGLPSDEAGTLCPECGKIKPPVRPRVPIPPSRCVRCKYNLEGITPAPDAARQCPECGEWTLPQGMKARVRLHRARAAAIGFVLGILPFWAAGWLWFHGAWRTPRIGTLEPLVAECASFLLLAMGFSAIAAIASRVTESHWRARRMRRWTVFWWSAGLNLATIVFFVYMALSWFPTG